MAPNDGRGAEATLRRGRPAIRAELSTVEAVGPMVEFRGALGYAGL